MKVWRITIPIYNETFVLFADCPEADAGRRYDAMTGGDGRSKSSADGEVFDGLTYVLSGRGRVYLGPGRAMGLWVADGLPRAIGAGVLAHEAAHLAAHLLKAIGCRLTESVMDEPFAYLLGWIVEECAGRLWSEGAGAKPEA